VSAVDLSEQVYDLLLDRAGRLGALVGGADLMAQLEQQAVHRARAVTAMLRHGNDHEVAELVMDLYVLAHGDGVAPAEWWRTPLGGVVARSIERDDSEAVSPRVAARMLDVSEATVYRWREEQKLSRHSDGGVTRASVLEQIAAASIEARAA
jgi:hypothetical protein